MKILHTSDWHIGHMLYNWDRSDEHKLFFEKLKDTIKTEKPDALVICGDIFHNTAPSSSAQKMYIENMLRIHEAFPEMTTVIIAGNHDSGSRLETDRMLWSHFNVHVVGNISRDYNDGSADRHIIPVGNPAKGYIIAIPHCYPQNFPDMGDDLPREKRPAAFINSLLRRVSEINNEGLPVVMTAHATVVGSDPKKQNIIVGGIDSINISELGDGYDYLALGHIHFPQTIGGKARYSGSAIPVSFNEDYPHSLSIVEIESHGAAPAIRTIGLPLLRQVVTIPEGEAVPFEEALEELRKFPEDREAYIRLNVKVKQYGGADWAAKAEAATEGKKCRYCCINLSTGPIQEVTGNERQLSQEELMEKDPLDIAELHWLAEKGCEMDERLREKLEGIIRKTVG